MQSNGKVLCAFLKGDKKRIENGSSICPVLPYIKNIYIYIIYKVTRGKWEVGVHRRNGSVTNDASAHLVSSTYNDAMQ